jgi:hypothetical protein
MMWVKRCFQYADYAPYMDLLEKRLMANPTLYQEFIMVSIETGDKPGESEYYVGVPHKALLQGFEGFTPVEESELPKEIDSVLIADQTKEPFRSRFRFKARE